MERFEHRSMGRYGIRGMVNQGKCISYLISLFVILLWQTLVNATSISVRAPVNPVEEDGIISVYCQVKNLDKRWQEVTMFRNVTTHIEKLSVNDDVLQAVGDHVFLAKRQLEGSSFVYFLSVIRATKEDAGEYFCKIADTAGIATNLPMDSVVIHTTFFPPATDPVCSPTGTRTITEGEVLTLTCSSELSNPVVNIEWHRTGGSEKLLSKEYIENGRIYSVATVTIMAKDTGVIFLCQITSEAYFDKKQTCHYGPLQVVSETGNSSPNLKPDIITGITPSTKQAINTHSGDYTDGTSSNTKTFEADCRDTCVSKPSSLLYWVLATVSACVIALIFLIIVTVLLMKTRRGDDDKRHRSETTCMRPNLPTDDIYTELESRRSQNKVYLSIQNSLKRESR